MANKFFICGGYLGLDVLGTRTTLAGAERLQNKLQAETMLNLPIDIMTEKKYNEESKKFYARFDL